MQLQPNAIDLYLETNKEICCCRFFHCNIVCQQLTQPHIAEVCAPASFFFAVFQLFSIRHDVSRCTWTELSYYQLNKRFCFIFNLRNKM